MSYAFRDPISFLFFSLQHHFPVLGDRGVGDGMKKRRIK